LFSGVQAQASRKPPANRLDLAGHIDMGVRDAQGGRGERDALEAAANIDPMALVILPGNEEQQQGGVADRFLLPICLPL